MFNAGRQSFLLSAVICLLLAGLFAARYVLAPYPVEGVFGGGMPLAALFTEFTANFPLGAAACALVLLVWTLVVVVQLTVRYAPSAGRNYLPAQIFLIAGGGIVISGEALASLVSAWLLALSMRQFVFSFHKEYKFAEVFHAGFYMGIIPLLYAPAAVVATLATVAALSIYRRSAREVTVCLAGMLLPVPLAGFVHWATGSDADFIYRELWRCASAIPDRSYMDMLPVSAAIVAGLTLLLVLIASVRALAHRKNIRKTPYKFVQHASFVLATLLASVAIPGSSFALVSLVAVAVALPLPYAFSGERKVAPSVIYCLIIVAVLIFNLARIAGFQIP